MTKKFEYYSCNVGCIETYDKYIDDSRLNSFGDDGWELVCIKDNELIFKRELIN